MEMHLLAGACTLTCCSSTAPRRHDRGSKDSLCCMQSLKAFFWRLFAKPTADPYSEQRLRCSGDACECAHFAILIATCVPEPVTSKWYRYQLCRHSSCVQDLLLTTMMIFRCSASAGKGGISILMQSVHKHLETVATGRAIAVVASERIDWLLLVVT